MGWATLAQGRVDVLPLSGSHTDIFAEQNVRTVADAPDQGFRSGADKLVAHSTDPGPDPACLEDGL